MLHRTCRGLCGAAVLALALAGGTEARQGGVGPGVPIRPRPGQKDWQLYDKAVRLQAGMWHHLSPEGLLVYVHRVGAGPEELSHDATLLSDVAIWTGCYAASQACRWKVTRDPDALRQCQVLARGLALLSNVAGEPGCLARNAGKLRPGEPLGENVEPSAKVPGLCFRGDVSRDQLAGVVLGWAMLDELVREDPEVVALAKLHMGAIARRLKDGRMWLRDAHGKKTKYGELRDDVEYAPFLRNGPLAAIGLATMVVASRLDPADDLSGEVRKMRREGWDDALRHQQTELPSLVNASNVNMVNLALLALARRGDPGGIQAQALQGLETLRFATVGWWNAGFCACQLLAGVEKDRPRILDEIRATLHEMTELEEPPGQESIFDLDRITTVAEKGPQSWTWADNVRRLRRFVPWPDPARRTTTTRADYLFAYWLARAAGELRPRVGPGADPTAHAIPVRRPPWMSEPVAPAPSAR